MDKITKQIKAIAHRYPAVNRVMLFGSRARGDERVDSDYDIAVFGADEKTAALFANDIDELQTLYKIDVIFISNRMAGTPIYANIMKEGTDIMNKFILKLENYEKAVCRLQEAIDETLGNSSPLMRDGVIQRFEFTTELAWKALREYLLQQGETEINSPKPVLRAAFRTTLIQDETGWIEILNDRNATSHIYDDDEAQVIYERIAEKHIILFKKLLSVLKTKEI